MKIRLLEERDLAEGLALTKLVGWNQTMRDWRFFFEQPNNNHWVAEESQSIIGTAMSLWIPPNLFWIGMVLVRPEFRGRGIGRRLMENIVNNCAGSIVRLDASNMGFPLYQKMGFVVDEQISRFLLTQPISSESKSHHQVFPIRPKDLPLVCSYDKTKSGVDRRHIIENFCEQEMGLLYPDRSKIKGYALTHQGRLTNHLGPIIADNVAAAKVLISSACQHMQMPISVDVFDRHTELIQFIEQLGFKRMRSFKRMTYKDSHSHMDNSMYCSFDPAMS